MGQVFEIGAGGLKPISTAGKNELMPGRVLQLNGYSNPKYLIVKNTGINPRFPEYGARYECVNLDTFARVIEDAYTLKWLSEKKDGRIAVYITDEILDADAVMDAVQNRDAAALVKQAEEQKKAQAKKDGLAMLPAMYPKLTPMEKAGKISTAALGAKNIKKELAEAFPGVKFSVKSDYYAGGCSIDVNWTDGPTCDQVKAISDKYQECDFNGMDDSTEYRKQIFTKVFGGAKYVMEQRSCSNAAYAAAAKDLGYPDAVMGTGGDMVGPGLTYDISQMIKRAAWGRAFYPEKAAA